MDRQKLRSTLVTPTSRRYCVGVVSDGELHLSPVDAVVALRPSFDYLDRGDKKGRQEARELGEGTHGDGRGERVRAVSVRDTSGEGRGMRVPAGTPVLLFVLYDLHWRHAAC